MLAWGAGQIPPGQTNVVAGPLSGRESSLRGMPSAHFRNRSITAYHFARNAAHVFLSDWRSARLRLLRFS